MALGLEWLFRWMTEPRRLFYRYAYHNPRFVALITWQLLRERCGAPVVKRLFPASADDTSEEAQVTSGVPEISRSETDAQSLQKLLRQKRGQLMLKRLLDITGALFSLALLGFPLLVIALLVRLGSPGPVIFSQARVGRRGKHFVMYKFRTMRAQRDPAADEAQAAAAKAGILVKGKDDSRVTGIGRFLRSTSLDELPQLFNVLKGDMSFVGPRPLIPFMLAGHPEFAEARALMRPGITGLWQVHERENNTSAQVMMPYDLEYIRRFSLGRDLGILLRTPFVVFAGNGAV
jgi:lipopolysaccharide/colanic/teichoic acid biosynthesis glycosyltransferase